MYKYKYIVRVFQAQKLHLLHHSIRWFITYLVSSYYSMLLILTVNSYKNGIVVVRKSIEPKYGIMVLYWSVVISR